MPKTRKWLLLRWFFRLALLVVLLLAGLAAFLLIAPGRPSAEAIHAIQKQREKVRAQYPAWLPPRQFPENAPPDTLTPSTATLADGASAMETDQQRCDRLFRELLDSIQRMPRHQEPEVLEGNYYFIDEKMMAKAHELAGFYEKSIRVSPDGLNYYHLKHGRLLGLLADLLARGESNPGRQFAYYDYLRTTLPNSRMTDKDLTCLFEALRFLRVTGCPAWGLTSWQTEVNWRLKGLLDPGLFCSGYDMARDTLPPLPAAIATMDLELLAPRKLNDWEQYLGQLMELRQVSFEYQERGTHPVTAFREWRSRIESDFATIKNPKTLDRIAFKGCSLVFLPVTTIVDHPGRIKRFKQELGREKDFLSYLGRAIQSGPIPEVPEDTFQALRTTNEQLESRVLAGALELRRGRPIPKPEEIKPGDYLFDPITRQPMRFYRLPAVAGMTRLCLFWPVRPVAQDLKEGIFFWPKQLYLSVLLPETHPGLANVPELKNPPMAK